jgi:hypothetical protein
MLKGKYIYIYLMEQYTNQILPSTVEYIHNQNQTAVKPRNMTKTPCFSPCVVCPLGAKNETWNARKNIVYLLADHAGTELPWSTGEGEQRPNNFRPPRTGPNFVDLPGSDPTQPCRSRPVAPTWWESGGARGRKREKGTYAHWGPAAEHRRRFRSERPAKQAAE